MSDVFTSSMHLAEAEEQVSRSRHEPWIVLVEVDGTARYGFAPRGLIAGSNAPNPLRLRPVSLLGLPEDFDADVFVGLELQEMRFVPYRLDLMFDRDVLIKVFAAVEHQSERGSSSWREGQLSGTGPFLMSLLGHRVTSARVEGTRANLILSFDSGDTLTIVADEAPYESYHLELGSDETIV